MSVASLTLPTVALVGSLLKICADHQESDTGKLRVYTADRVRLGARDAVKMLAVIVDSYGGLKLEQVGEKRKAFAVQHMASVFQKMCFIAGPTQMPEFQTPVLQAFFDAPAHCNPDIQLSFLTTVADSQCSGFAERLRCLARNQRLSPGVPRLKYEFSRRDDGLYFIAGVRFGGHYRTVVEVRLANSNRQAASNGQQCFFLNEQAQDVTKALEGLMNELEEGRVLGQLQESRNVDLEVKSLCERLRGSLAPADMDLLTKNPLLTLKYLGIPQAQQSA